MFSPPPPNHHLPTTSCAPCQTLHAGPDGTPAHPLLSPGLADAVGATVRGVALRAWRAGLRRLYPTPVQLHLLLRNALATLVVGALPGLPGVAFGALSLAPVPTAFDPRARIGDAALSPSARCV